VPANGLNPILRPASVAVIGASRNPTKRGYQAVRTLLDTPYQGRIYAVNPQGGTLFDLQMFTSVEDLPEAPDLAFVCTPAESIPDILEHCAGKGIRGAVVSAVGFKESGEVGAALEHQIAEVVKQTGIRLVGPNTSGILNTAVGLNLVGVRNVRPGSIALLSQSGNVALDVMNTASEWGTGISTYVGVGNETDIAFHEYLEYLEQDPTTLAIMVYVEGFRNGRTFIEVAKRVAVTKPIIILKGGRSDRGVAAARSHTGAIAGSYPVLRAALRQGGVSEVLRSDELFPVAMTLAHQPAVPAGSSVAVVSDGGGHGTLTADALTELGVPMATLSEATKRNLRETLGRAASVENPVDVAGAADADPSVLARTLEIVANDRDVGGVMLVGLFGGYAIRFAEALSTVELTAAEKMIETFQRAAKPLVVHSLFAARKSDPLVKLVRGGVPVVGSLEIGSRCLRASHARGLFLADRPVPVARPAPRKGEPACIASARREGRTTLMETEVRELLGEHGVNLVPATLCRSAEELDAAMTTTTGPVAMKIVSPAISHKTDAGGVELNISSVKKAQAAFKRIMEKGATYAVKHGAAPDIRGVLVSPMLHSPVAELIVGVRDDPQFGHALSVGAGGTAVEVHHDTSLRGLPVGRTEVLEMLQEIRIAKILGGYRGRAAADTESLATIILGITACALSHPELDELEANPVFAFPDHAVVVDARAFLKDLTKEPRART